MRENRMTPQQVIAVAVSLLAVWPVLDGKGFRKVFWWAQTAGY
jgi:hypothetical protein